MDTDSEECLLGNWPRRLLHVPTMTSFEWQPGNKYGDHVAPKYNAISYTWGRWEIRGDGNELPEVESVPIKNVPWKVPRIHPSHFTVGQFTDVIQRVAKTSPYRFEDVPTHMMASIPFLWLDVACIDQRPSEPKQAAEVGRQAAIFRGAQHAFVWLTTQEQEAVDPLIESSPIIDELFECTQLDIEDGWSEEPQQNFSIEQMRSSLYAASLSLDGLLNDPWFTSLWTLQEAFIRSDSLFISKSGALITYPRSMRPYYPWKFSDLLSWTDKCHRMSQDRSNTMPVSFLSIANLIERRGLRAIATRNPIATHEAASGRTTTRPEDRVYGIQQIFDLRLGASAPNAKVKNLRSYSVEQLEDELGLALLQQLPMSSQFHHFTEPVSQEHQWRFRNCSYLPLQGSTYNCYMDEKSENMVQSAKFDVVAGSEHGVRTICIESFSIGFEELIQATRMMNERESDPGHGQNAILTTMTLYMDASDHNVPASYIGSERYLEAREWEKAARAVLALYYKDTIRVVSLGVSCGFWACRMYGLLMQKEEGNKWRRRGLCFWEKRNMPHEVAASTLDGFLGHLGADADKWTVFRGDYGTLR